MVALFTETGRLLDKWLVNSLGLIMLFKIADFNVIVELPELFYFAPLHVSSPLAVTAESFYPSHSTFCSFRRAANKQHRTHAFYLSMEKPMAYLDATFAESSLH